MGSATAAPVLCGRPHHCGGTLDWAAEWNSGEGEDLERRVFLVPGGPQGCPGGVPGGSGGVLGGSWGGLGAFRGSLGGVLESVFGDVKIRLR